MSHVTLSGIYDRVLLREPVKLEGISEREYGNLRTSLLRKFRKSKDEFQSCGLPWPYEREFIECRFSKATSSAEFKLSPEGQRRTRSVQFKLSEI